MYDYISIQDQGIDARVHLEPGSNDGTTEMVASSFSLNQYPFKDEMKLRFKKESHKSRERSINNGKVKQKSFENRRKRSAAIVNNSKKWFGKRHRRLRRTIESRDGYYLTRNNAQSFLPYVRWCGTHETNMSKFDFVAQSNEILLNFHSDYSINGMGFAAIWKAIDVTSCPSRTLTSRDGIVFSPNYPHFLLNNLKCVFVLRAPVGRRVWLQFNDYDLQNDALLEVDIGRGYFLPFQSSQHYNDGLFVSLKEQIRVQLRTGQNPRGKGFHANYHTGKICLI